jgi:hypothetical protein
MQPEKKRIKMKKMKNEKPKRKTKNEKRKTKNEKEKKRKKKREGKRKNSSVKRILIKCTSLSSGRNRVALWFNYGTKEMSWDGGGAIPPSFPTPPPPPEKKEKTKHPHFIVDLFVVIHILFDLCYYFIYFI